MTQRKLIWLAFWSATLAGVAPPAFGTDSELIERAEAIRVWHTADVSDSVTAVLQTRDGFLWIGGNAGLARFDGFKFTQTPLGDASTNNPVGITALCEDASGHLWIGTQREGLFELADGKVRRFSKGQGLIDNNVTSLAADDHGLVWIGSKSGLELWTGETFKSFTAPDGLPDEFVSGVNVARSGAVWITTVVGMCQFTNGRIAPYEFRTDSQGRRPEYLGAYEDRRGNLWAFGDTYLINLTEGKRFNYFRSSESASVRIWSLCEGQNGRLWIGTSGRGLFCFEDNRFQPVLLGEDRWPYDVRAICEDREGNLWLGTSGGGLVQLRPQSLHVLRASQGLPTSPPTALALDAAGRIYVGLERGGLYVGESTRFDRVGGNDKLEVQNLVSGVSVARDGTIWAGTLGDGLYGLRNGREIHFTTADGLTDDSVLSLCVDSADRLWFSTSAGVVHRLDGSSVVRFDSKQHLPQAPVTSIAPSARGGLWLGTQDGQLLREENGKFTLVPQAGNAGRHPVITCNEGKAGRLWIGTAGGGLTCFVGGTTLNWNLSSGLPSDFVAGVVEDDATNLWLSTSSGIYRVKHSELIKSLEQPRIPLTCHLMSEAKTAPESTTGFGATRAILSPDGELWFATSEGLLNVDTHASDAEPATIPVCIESAAFNRQWPILLLHGGIWQTASSNSSPYRAPVDLRSLEIHFTASSFISPGELRFRHRLEGSEQEWVDDAGARVVRYGRLPYGRYRFRVAARRGDGAWQEAAEAFAFVVPTPLYLQTWAICLYGIIAVALVVEIVRIVSHRRLRRALVRLEQQQTLERERMRIARDMHDEIGSKLTKISFLSEHAQVDAESAAGPLAGKVQSIAQTSRELLKTMDEIVWAVNPRNDKLENLAAYFSHYAIEYFQNTNVDCQLRLPQEIPEYPLSSEARHNLFLAFEEALNNALKHSGATIVRVEMGLTALEFEVRIIDNGKGFEVPVSTEPAVPARNGRSGSGLRNMRQRLAAVGGDCVVSSRVGQGTTVTLGIRLNRKEVEKS